MAEIDGVSLKDDCFDKFSSVRKKIQFDFVKNLSEIF